MLGSQTVVRGAQYGKQQQQSTMATVNNKDENEFPYEIKEADGDMKEQFIRDFQGR